MSSRFTDSEKWNDPWFRRLPSESKLLFLYLCDQCDVAGFWEIDTELAAIYTKLDEETVKQALGALGEKIATNGRHIWLRNFIRRQNNLPLNPTNNAHRGIIKRLIEHQGISEDIDGLLSSVDLSSFSLAPHEGLVRSTGKGKGNGKGSRGRRGTEKRGKYEAEFEAWWSGEDGEPPYPRKKDKKSAEAKYVAARKKASREELAVGKRHFVQYVIQEQTEEGFIPYAATWLNKERWHDFQEPPKPSGKRSVQLADQRPASEYAGVVKSGD